MKNVRLVTTLQGNINFAFTSALHGYHVYKDVHVWKALIGEAKQVLRNEDSMPECSNKLLKQTANEIKGESF